MTYCNKINSLLLALSSLLISVSSEAADPVFFALWEEKIFPYNPYVETEEHRFTTNLPKEEWASYITETIKEDEIEKSKRFIDLGSNNILIVQTQKENTIDLDIRDSGKIPSALLIIGEGVTTLTGNNTHRGWTNIKYSRLAFQSDESLGAPFQPISLAQGTLILINDSTNATINRPVQIVENTTATFDVPSSTSALSLNGEISGKSSKGLIKKGAGKLVLNGANIYEGNTVIEDGELHVKAKNLPTDIENNGKLIFHTNGDEEFTRQITGFGTINVKGPGSLSFTKSSDSFKGKTEIQAGHLALNATLSGNVIISEKGILSGTGTVLGNLFIEPAGIIAPTKNPNLASDQNFGKMVVSGNYVQNQATTFLVNIHGRENNSLIGVSKQALLQGDVVFESHDGIRLDKTYTILEADGGIIGSFDSVKNIKGERELYIPLLSYDDTRAFLNFESSIFNAAETFNQRQAARQLDGITDPTASQVNLLNAIVNLSLPHARHTLNQISGQQHAADLLIVEVVNRQFTRRLYDPLRDIIGSDPCIREWYENESCGCYGIDTWVEGSGSYLSQKGGSNTTGFKYDGGEITLGAMKTFDCDLTAGIAGSYEYDYIKYHLGGKGSLNTVLGSIYGLYRPAKFYILTNLNLSYSVNHIKRSIEIGSLNYQAKSSPKITSINAYGEFGIDYRWEDLLIQPFLGVEAGHIVRSKVNEHGADDLNLTIKNRKHTNVNSRLGVHLNAQNLPTDFNAYIDLAWNYRWTKTSNYLDEHFETFGNEFAIEGIHLYKNSFEGTFAVTKDLCNGWNFLAEYSVQFWKRSYSYYALGGFEYKW